MATRTIKTQLVISGEKEYREALSRVSAELRSQKSNLKLLDERYKGNANSQEALQKKVEALTATKQAQQKVLSALKDGLDNARVKQAEYTAQVTAAEEKIAKTNIRLEELKDSTKDTTEEQAKLQAELKDLETELQKCAENQQMSGNAVEEWQKKYFNAQAGLNSFSLKLEENKKYLEEASNSTDHCATSIDAYGKKVKHAEEQEGRFNTSTKNTEGAVNALSATLAAAGVKEGVEEITEALMECVDASAAFETGLKKISTIADSSKASLETIKDEIVDLSGQTGEAASDLAESTYSAISASVDTAEAVKFVGYATKLSVGGFTSSATSVDVLTTALNAYKMNVSEVEKVSDYLITTQNLGKTTVDELASSVGKVIPVAAAYGVEMDNLSTAYAIMTANGIATAESTTYLKSMLNELGDSGSVVSGILEEETGMSFAQLMKRGNSLGDVMAILGNAVNNDTGAFNELWSSSEAGIGALSLLGAGTEKYSAVLQQMQESTGATEKAYEAMANTSEMAQKRMSNAFENLKITIGDQLRPQMDQLYETGEDVLTWASEFVAENEYLVPTITALTIGLAALTVGAAAYAVTTTVLIPLVTAFNAALAANPLLAVAAALGVLIVSLQAFTGNESDAIKKTKEFSQSVDDLTESIHENTNAYKEQRETIESTARNTKSLLSHLDELLRIEKKSAAEKELILDIVEQLNEEIPELALNYDKTTDSVNRTVAEMQLMVEEQEKMSQYENSANSYADAYARQQEAIEQLRVAEEGLASTKEAIAIVAEKQAASTQEEIRACKEAKIQEELYTESIAKLKATIEETEATMETMKDEMNLYAIQTADLLPVHEKEIETLLANAEVLKSNQEAYAAEIESISQVAEGYQNYADSVKAHVGTVMEQIKELQEKYQESYDNAYINISNQIGLFEKMSIESDESIHDLIGSMESQVEYMNQYAENIRLAMEYGVDKGIVEKLSDGSKESAAYLAAIVEDGGKNIDELNNEFRRVNEGKEDFAEAIAEMQTDYEKTMDDLLTKAAQAVEDMAMYDESYEAAVNTCMGLIDGVDDMWDDVITKHRELAKAATRAYNEQMQIKSPSRAFKWSAQMEMEGIIAGLQEKEKDVADSHKKLAQESIVAYQKETEKLYTDQLMIAAAAGSINFDSNIKSNDESSQRYLKRIIDLLGSRKEIGSSAAGVMQEINIYQPVKSPVETARELKRVGKELAFG